MFRESGDTAEKESLILDILGHLDQIADSERGYTRTKEDSDRQLAVLENLLAVDSEFVATFSKRGPKMMNAALDPYGSTIDSLAKTEVFEALVRNDTIFFGTLETPAAAEVRRFVQNPSAYTNDERFNGLRNPDIAMVNEKGEIAGYIEVTMGELDDRKLEQIKPSGSEQTIRFGVHFLHDNYKQLEGWGLPALAAKKREEIKVVRDGFETVVVVPKEKDVSRPNTLINKHISNSKQVELEDLLKKVNVRSAAFSTEETIVVLGALLGVYAKETLEETS